MRRESGCGRAVRMATESRRRTQHHIEGVWTGVRNFLHPFRGVNKLYLQQYLAIHEWAHNLKKEVALDFLRILCGVTQLAS